MSLGRCFCALFGWRAVLVLLLEEPVEVQPVRANTPDRTNATPIFLNAIIESM